MNIREFRDDDLAVVLDIWLRASIKAHHFVPPEFWKDRVDDMRDIYLPAAEIHVCEDNGTIHGFFALHDDRLAAIFVAPEIQGQGVGDRLLGRAKTLRDRLIISVYHENRRATRFYRNRGFQMVSTGIDTHTGERELMMQWARDQSF